MAPDEPAPPLLEARDLRRAALRGLLAGALVAGGMALVVARNGLPASAVQTVLVAHLPLGVAAGLAALAEAHAGARLRRGGRLGPALLEVWAAALAGLLLALTQGLAIGRALLRRAPLDAPHEALAAVLELVTPTTLGVFAVAALPLAAVAHTRWRGLALRSQVVRSAAAAGASVVVLRALGPSAEAVGGVVLFGLLLPLLLPPAASLADRLEGLVWRREEPPPPLAGDAGSGCASAVLAAAVVGLALARLLLPGRAGDPLLLALLPAALVLFVVLAGAALVRNASRLELHAEPAAGPPAWLEPAAEAAAQADLEAAGFRTLGALELTWRKGGAALPAMEAREVILTGDGEWAAVVHVTAQGRPRPTVRAVGCYLGEGPVRRIVVLDRPFDPANHLSGAAPGSVLVSLPGAGLPALRAALLAERARWPAPVLPTTLEAVRSSELETWAYRARALEAAPAWRLVLALLRGPTGGRLANTT